MVTKEISERVLTVGSQYHNHRGGIGGVLENYSVYFDPFNYICTYSIATSKVKLGFGFLKSLVLLIYTLSFKRKISIVHIHGAAKGSVFRKYIIFNISKRVFRKLVVFHSHASEMKIFYDNGGSIVKWICKDFFSNVDLIICLSQSWKEFFIDNFQPKKIEVLENIVEPAIVSRKAEIQQDYAIVFLFLGAIGQRKGIFDLLEVIKTNKKELDGKVKLWIGGNGQIEELQNVISKNKLEKIVEFKGWVSGNLKKELLSKANVYILPSYNEGLPLSILEAMTYGLPIISTKVGGIPEILKNEFNGVLIEPGNLMEIYRAIDHFVQRPQDLLTYGNNSRQVVEPYYAGKVMPKLEEIYERLLT